MPSFVELTLDDDNSSNSDNFAAPDVAPSIAPADSTEEKKEETSVPSLIDFAAEPVDKPEALGTDTSSPVVEASAEVPNVNAIPSVVAVESVNEPIQPISEIAEVKLNEQGMLQTDTSVTPVVSSVPAPAPVLDLTDDDDDDTSGFEPDFS
jgi:hypothetical protein